jgi:hypothetical protein
MHAREIVVGSCVCLWQHLHRYAALSNLMDVPTDCPQRERRGWLGDAQLAAETEIANFDIAALHTKVCVPCRASCAFGFGRGARACEGAVMPCAATHLSLYEQPCVWVTQWPTSPTHPHPHTPPHTPRVCASCLRQFLRDIRDTQLLYSPASNGSLPDCVPFYNHGKIPGDPAWTAAYPLIASWVSRWVRHRAGSRACGVIYLRRWQLLFLLRTPAGAIA